MALSPSGFQIEEDQQSINQTSSAQGLGTPESPLGAKVAGASPDQAKMAGTPAQQQGAQQIPGQQPTQPQTLTERQRYEQAGSQSAQDRADQARQTAEDLKVLGPTRVRVQAMVDQQLANIQNANAQATLDQTALESAQYAEGVEAADAETLLNDYLALVNDPNADPVAKETALQAVSDAIPGFDPATFIQASGATIGTAAAGMVADDFNIGLLVGDGPNQMTQAELDGLAGALGMTVEEVSAMTLAELNSAIDAVEAQEFEQVSNIQAQLADPNLPPALREQLQGELEDISAAGVVGLEAEIDLLDQQIQAGETLDFMGQEMSIEDILSDENISRTIANAVNDPAELEKLRADPRFTSLANWIDTNKANLEAIVGDLTEEVEAYQGVQTQYSEVSKSLGENSKELFAALGIDLPESMTSSQLADFNSQLTNNSVYQVLLGNSDWRTAEDIAVLNKLRESGFSKDQMESYMDFMDQTQEAGNDVWKSLFGDAPSDPQSFDDFRKYQKQVEEYEDLPDNIKNGTLDLVKNGTLDMEDLLDLRDMPELLQDRTIESYKTMLNDTRAFNTEMAALDGEARQEYLMQKLGLSGVDKDDLNYAISSGSAAADRIKRLFDANNDGVISDKEFNNLQSAKVASELGLGQDIQSMIDNKGNYGTTPISVDVNANEAAAEKEKEANAAIEQERISAEQDTIRQEIRTITDHSKYNSFLATIGALDKSGNFDPRVLQAYMPQIEDFKTKQATAKKHWDILQKAQADYEKAVKRGDTRAISAANRALNRAKKNWKSAESDRNQATKTLQIAFPAGNTKLFKSWNLDTLNNLIDTGNKLGGY